MEIVKVKDEKLGIDYGWVYRISTPEQLRAYWDDVAQPRWSYGFGDFLATAGSSHATTAEGNIIRTMADATGKSPLMVLGEFSDRSYLAMASALQFGPIAINRNGGFFPLRGQKAIEAREVETWTLPGAKLKISQWPNGKHFYARIGDEDVIESDRNKWDSREAAERAAKRFARAHNIFVDPVPC